MHKILAAIDAQEPASEALFRACSLAQRTDARVCVLLVFPDEAHEDLELRIRGLLEPIIEGERLKGTYIEYFIVKGDFKREVIRFIMEHDIDFIVLAQTGKKLRTAIDIQRITGCKTEFVRYKMKPF